MVKKILLVFSFIFTSNYAYAETLLEARKGFKTRIVKEVREPAYSLKPPAGTVSLIKYQTELGLMSAYLSEVPKSDSKLPAIIWITGGFPAGGIGESAWEARPSSNDQSAKIYRQKGIVIMYPSFRGADGNVGVQESFYGEVNDVLSALEYIKKLEYVDSNNIYLGGHSTGGTLALLVAQSTDEFKAVFSFGPVAASTQYGAENVLHDLSSDKEIELRAPALFMNAIKADTYILEGSEGNIDALRQLESYTMNQRVRFVEVEGSDHFELLQPINEYIANKMLTNMDSPLILTAKELLSAYGKN